MSWRSALDVWSSRSLVSDSTKILGWKKDDVADDVVGVSKSDL